jgi:hypothetical protein
MRRAGLRRISLSCRVFRKKRSSSVGMTPLVSSQRIRSQRGLIRRIGPTAPANPAHSGQTLLRCCEPAIRGPSPLQIVIGTPQIVLRRSRFFKATESGKHTKDEQRIPHGNLLVIPVTKSGQWLISQVEPAEAVDAARRSRHCSNVVKRQFVIPPTTPSL